ncbi:hypothetical protein N0V90_001830 [Kalmusia sp. IMI 367209]|nr:hypothetical protein N0V90_001830 [Kalmusia sp. IMI 367209]
MASNAHVEGHGVQIWWQKTDQAALAAGAAATSTMSMPTVSQNSATNTSSSKPPSDTLSSHTSSSLSTSASDTRPTDTLPPSPTSKTSLPAGTKASIGIGLAILVIIGCSIVFILVRRRRLSSEVEKPNVSELGVSEAATEMSHESISYEMPAKPIPIELHTGSAQLRPFELDSAPYGRT